MAAPELSNTEQGTSEPMKVPQPGGPQSHHGSDLKTAHAPTLASSHADASSSIVRQIGVGCPSRYDWSKYMPLIRQLHLEEDRPLKEVMRIMEEEHGFVATTRQFKVRLKQWGYTKSIPHGFERRLSIDELEAHLVWKAQHQQVEVQGKGFTKIAAKDMNIGTVSPASVQHDDGYGLIPSLSGDNSTPVTSDAHQTENFPTERLDDDPRQNSANNTMYVSKEADGKIGYIDRFRLFVEKIFGEELDWSPLPPVEHAVGLHQSRVYWTYNGMKMSIPLNEDETSRHGGRSNDYHGSSNILPVHQPAPQTAVSASSSTNGNLTARDPAWKQIMPWFWTKSNRDSTDPLRRDPGDKGNIQQLESHLCVDKCWSSSSDTRMITLESVDDMKSDYEYFCQARNILSQAEGSWLQRKLSWRSYTRVSLSRFHFLFDNSDKVEAIEFTSLPSPQDVCSGYEFKCSKGAEIDIQMRIYAKIILEGVRCPELGRGSRTLLDGIPKLKTPPGLVKKAMNSGWGFHARHGLSVAKMLGWAMIILMIGLGFVPFWLSSIDRLDLQNALAPASFLVTVVTLWVAVLAVNTGFKQE